jgi:hypothetical protein
MNDLPVCIFYGCRGDGTCIQQIDLDEDGDDIYEFNGTCELKKCGQFPLCTKERPAWFLDCHSGNCLNCNMYLGNVKEIECNNICPVCTEERYTNINLKCNHLVCKECWFNWTVKNKKNSCPLCRKNNSWI